MEYAGLFCLSPLSLHSESGPQPAATVKVTVSGWKPRLPFALLHRRKRGERSNGGDIPRGKEKNDPETGNSSGQEKKQCHQKNSGTCFVIRLTIASKIETISQSWPIILIPTW